MNQVESFNWSSNLVNFFQRKLALVQYYYKKLVFRL